MNEAVEKEWERLRTVEDPDFRKLVVRASAEPAIRSLFPYRSLGNLRFSKAATYPYDTLPYIISDPLNDRYQLRDAGNAPLVLGSLDEVVVSLAQVLDAPPDRPSADEYCGTVVDAIVTTVEAFCLFAEHQDDRQVLNVIVAITSSNTGEQEFAVGQTIRVGIQRVTALGSYVGALVP